MWASGLSSQNASYYYYFPLDMMLVHHRVTPCNKFTGAHLFTRTWREALWVKHLALKHNTLSLGRAPTQTKPSLSGDKCTNHEATVPLSFMRQGIIVIQLPSWFPAGLFHRENWQFWCLKHEAASIASPHAAWGRDHATEAKINLKETTCPTRYLSCS